MYRAPEGVFESKVYKLLIQVPAKADTPSTDKLLTMGMLEVDLADYAVCIGEAPVPLDFRVKLKVGDTAAIVCGTVRVTVVQAKLALDGMTNLSRLSSQAAGDSAPLSQVFDLDQDLTGFEDYGNSSTSLTAVTPDRSGPLRGAGRRMSGTFSRTRRPPAAPEQPAALTDSLTAAVSGGTGPPRRADGRSTPAPVSRPASTAKASVDLSLTESPPRVAPKPHAAPDSGGDTDDSDALLAAAAEKERARQRSGSVQMPQTPPSAPYSPAVNSGPATAAAAARAAPGGGAVDSDSLSEMSIGSLGSADPEDPAPSHPDPHSPPHTETWRANASDAVSGPASSREPGAQPPSGSPLSLPGRSGSRDAVNVAATATGDFDAIGARYSDATMSGSIADNPFGDPDSQAHSPSASGRLKEDWTAAHGKDAATRKDAAAPHVSGQQPRDDFAADRALGVDRKSESTFANPFGDPDTVHGDRVQNDEDLLANPFGEPDDAWDSPETSFEAFSGQNPTVPSPTASERSAKRDTGASGRSAGDRSAGTSSRSFARSGAFASAGAAAVAAAGLEDEAGEAEVGAYIEARHAGHRGGTTQEIIAELRAALAETQQLLDAERGVTQDAAKEMARLERQLLEARREADHWRREKTKMSSNCNECGSNAVGGDEAAGLRAAEEECAQLREELMAAQERAIKAESAMFAEKERALEASKAAGGAAAAGAAAWAAERRDLQAAYEEQHRELEETRNEAEALALDLQGQLAQADVQMHAMQREMEGLRQEKMALQSETFDLGERELELASANRMLNHELQEQTRGRGRGRPPTAGASPSAADPASAEQVELAGVPEEEEGAVVDAAEYDSVVAELALRKLDIALGQERETILRREVAKARERSAQLSARLTRMENSMYAQAESPTASCASEAQTGPKTPSKPSSWVWGAR